jgi:phosphatidylglycerophosphatase A
MRKLLVSFFYLGCLPVAPGTWGSLGAAVIYLGIYVLVCCVWPHHVKEGVPWWVTAPLIAIACVISVALGKWAVEHYKSPDPKPFVLDEVAGMWLSMLFVPQDRIVWMLPLAFLLFRAFDVFKLPPARQAEHLPFGWGILCDDLVAGLQANIVLQFLFREHIIGVF